MLLPALLLHLLPLLSLLLPDAAPGGKQGVSALPQALLFGALQQGAGLLPGCLLFRFPARIGLLEGGRGLPLLFQARVDARLAGVHMLADGLEKETPQQEI